jgi:hypothetical protein
MPLFAEEGIWVAPARSRAHVLRNYSQLWTRGTLWTRWTNYSGDFRGATARSGLFRRRPLVHLSVFGGSRFLLRQSAQPPLIQDQIPILVMVCPSRKQRPACPYQCPGFGSQAPSRRTKSARSASSSTICRCSMPLTITWCSGRGLSSLACLGISSPRIPIPYAICPVSQQRPNATRFALGKSLEDLPVNRCHHS